MKIPDNLLKSFRNVHGNRYDYNVDSYAGANAQMAMICKTHGGFLQRPGNHRMGMGCPKCGRESASNKISLGLSKFIAKAKLIHGDLYDYTDSVYINNKTKINIKCKVHGIFSQSPHSHTDGKMGCARCAGNKKLDLLELKNSWNQIHNDSYSYESVLSLPKQTDNIIINCGIHGEFSQTRKQHSGGFGCPSCGKQKQLDKCDLDAMISANNFVDKANAIHNNFYNYAKTVYINSKTEITITCPTHGDFTQLPYNHLQGSGCLKCGSVSPKWQIEFSQWLSDLGVKHETSNRTIIKPLELDFYLTEYRIAIELNGLYWHSSDRKTKNYHLHKTNQCAKENIKLIHVLEDEWVNKKEIVKSSILHQLKKSTNVVYARKTKILSIADSKIVSSFLNDNHLMGKDTHQVAYGLFENELLLAVATFAKPPISGSNKKYDWSLSRFAIKNNYSVPGAFSRLLKRFEVDYAPKLLYTFADRRYSEGAVYINNGFKFVHNTKPNYWYFKPSEMKRYHRFGFRKSLLANKLENFDVSLTETENMKLNGWLSIWDCGNALFEKAI